MKGFRDTITPTKFSVPTVANGSENVSANGRIVCRQLMLDRHY
jgi:hypothetical protein